MSAQEHWIRCDKEKPDAETTVLVACVDGEVACAFYDDEHEGWFTPTLEIIQSTVTHWRHLPAPPMVKP